MKKIYFLFAFAFFASGAFAQSSQMCIVQVVANSTGNKCFGDCNGIINSYPGGTGTYKFSWSNGATTQNISGLCAGTYTLNITDLGDGSTCSGTATITTPAKLNVSIVGGSGMASALASGGVTPYTYSWTPSGQTGANATGLAPGVHTVTVTDKNGCTATATVTVSGTGIANSQAADQAIAVYPNPASGMISIELPVLHEARASLVNLLGEEVLNEQLAAGERKRSFDISTLPSGVYFIMIKHAEGVISAKVVKE